MKTEKSELSDIIFWSGYGFDRGTCNDLARQIVEHGYSKKPTEIEEKPHGKWLRMYKQWQCSNCGRVIDRNMDAALYGAIEFGGAFKPHCWWCGSQNDFTEVFK